MAGTAPAWRTANVAQNAGQLWANLAIPGAGARVTLDADGTPDATANPSAFHLGATTEGSRLMVKSSMTDFNVDEFSAPIITNISGVEAGISCNLVGVTEMDLLELLLPGVATGGTGSGYEQLQIGRKAITYTSIALIFPLIEDTTKYGIFHLYKALNKDGVEWQQGRTVLGSTPANFMGYEITSRAATDTIGNIWKQVT